MSAAALHGLSTEALRRLRALVATSGACPSSASLDAAGLGGVSRNVLDALGALPDAAWLPVVDAMLRERERAATRAAELVWSGPDAPSGEARASSVLVREMFARASTHVLVAGYTFDHGATLFHPLHLRASQHGVHVDIFVNVEQDATGYGRPIALGRDDVRTQLDAFVAENWPWGEPLPRLWYDARVHENKVFASLHAKCVVVDRAEAYVTSANFTERGVTRNIEVGVRVPDPVFATRLVGQFEKARAAGVFVAG